MITIIPKILPHTESPLVVSEPIARQQYIQMPILSKSMTECFQYNHNKELALCVPLFKNLWGMTAYEENVGDLHIHGFIKRAMYMVWELFNYTDFRDCGIPIYLVATRRVEPLLQPYLKVCDFPQEHVFISDIDEQEYAGYNVNYGLMKSFLKQNSFEKILWSDTSLYFLKDRKSDLFSKIVEQWEDEPVLLLLPVYCEFGHSPKLIFRKAVAAFKKINISEEDYYKKGADILGIPVSEFAKICKPDSGLPKFNIHGFFYGFRSEMLFSDSFNKILDKAKVLVGLDEALLTFHCFKNLKLSDIIVPDGVFEYWIDTGSARPNSNFGFMSRTLIHQLSQESIDQLEF